ncbi:MAG: penicillin-binding protein 1A [Desulfobacterales bacterium]
MTRQTRSKPSGSRFKKVLFWILGIGFFLAAAGAAGLAGLFFYISEGLPRIDSLADYHPPTITEVFADDGEKIAEFYRERRILMPLEDMPRTLIDAFVAAEDSRFWEHQGIDYQGILRAFFKNIEAGGIVQGGSTITQQVTKSFFLSPERSYTRKLKEAILAWRISKAFTKEEVLYLYLNQIYLGHGAYGVESAAQNYFGKSARDLTLAECAVLAGLPQAPSRYSPYRHPNLALERKHYVLRRMFDEGYITQEQMQSAVAEPMEIREKRNWFAEQVPYYTEHVRQYALEKFGPERLYNDGLGIHTAVTINLQVAAREEIEKGLKDLDKRQGYRGPIGHVDPAGIETELAQWKSASPEGEAVPGAVQRAVVTEVNDRRKVVSVRTPWLQGEIAMGGMKWARKFDPESFSGTPAPTRPGQVLKAGDVIDVRLLEPTADGSAWRLALEQIPKAQSALLCIEAVTGQVKAMVGGRDFNQSQFNRAIQSRRQPGSAFKPIIYAAAIDRGYTTASMVVDSPIVFSDTEREVVWKPKNYAGTFTGSTLLRDALARSLNVVTVKLLRDIGIDYAIDYARRLGIRSELNRDLSIALGSSGVSLLELVNAYAVFANQGYHVDPVFVTRIEDREGQIIEELHPDREKVIEKTTAYILTSMMESVVKEGTGRRVKALGRPVAGKTGTTNNLYDAWFVGYTPDYITGVWVGFDDEGSLGRGETGSKAATPIWLEFMKRAHDGKPLRDFDVPEGVVFTRIDAETGLLPIPESKETIFECFKEGTVPTDHTKPPDTISDSADFFKTGM